MRQIKFRSWNGEDIISPDYISRDGRANWKENSIPTSSDILMQFTGLLDKNGKEIYEGDIISYIYGSGIPSTSTVGWGGDVAGYIPFCDEGWSSRVDISTIEVIGNIYENS